MIKKIVILGFLLFIISIIPNISHAQQAGSDRSVDVSIDYPYYRSVKKTDIDGPTNLWPIKESRTEEKIGRSIIFNFFDRRFISKIPPLKNLFASTKSSKKDVKLNSPKYVETYHVTGCTTDHIYKTFSSLLDNTPGKIDGKTRTVCKGSGGYPGTDTGYISVNNEPLIYESQTRGESSIVYKDNDKTVKYSNKDETRAVLTIAPSVPEDLCATYGRLLINLCVGGAVSSLVPGGFVISNSGVITKISGELENLIFKNNPTWSITLKVDAGSLTPSVNANKEVVYSETSIPCSNIRVLGKNLNQDCTVTLNIREKDGLKDVTPTVNSSKYYKFNVSVVGAPVLNKTSIFSSIINKITPDAFAADEGGAVSMDNEGFMIVSDDNVPYLPMSTDIVPSPSPTPTPYSSYSSSVINSVLKFFGF